MTVRTLTLAGQLLLLLYAPVAWSTCEPGHIVLQVLGSGGPEMDDKRASSSYLVWIDGKARILVDSGGGSSLNFERSGARIEDLQAVLFSHFHVDHSADFPTLIMASYFTLRDRDLPVYGPEGNALMPSADEFVTGLFGAGAPWRYLGNYVDPEQASDYHLRVHTVHANRDAVTSIALSDTITLGTITVHHGPIPALAWRVNSSGCSITFSGDTSNRYRTVETLAQGTDILVAHNAVPEGASGIARNLHMPPSEIGLIAKHANIKQLVISHRMDRTLGREKQATGYIRKSWNGPLHFANDLDRFNP